MYVILKTTLLEEWEGLLVRLRFFFFFDKMTSRMQIVKG
jgi:hypothetical protein